MPLQDLTMPPAPPLRSDPPEVFIERAEAFVQWQETFAGEMTTLTTQLEAAAAMIATAGAYADPGLLALAGNAPAANKLAYFTGAATSALATLTAYARTLLDDADASAAQTTLGLGALALLASVNNANWAGADLAIANGGTGASTAGPARDNLGLGALAVLGTIDNANWAGTDLAIANGGTGASTAPAAFAAIAVLAESLAGNGYLQFQNGLHVLWGTFTAGANGATTFDYSTISAAIVLTSFSVAVASSAFASASAQDNAAGTTASSTTGLTVFNANDNALTVFFIAIGV